MFSKQHHRCEATVNASSMADIAFLLLIFFLVTTTIDIEKGIQVKLPPFDLPPPPPIHERNVLNVRINFADGLMADNKSLTINELRGQVKLFIMNPNNSEHLSTAPNEAIISLQNDRNTSYRTYLSVYNELKAAYHELWEEKAMSEHGMHFDQLSRRKQASIKDEIPLVISEGEVVDLRDKH